MNEVTVTMSFDREMVRKALLLYARAQTGMKIPDDTGFEVEEYNRDEGKSMTLDVKMQWAFQNRDRVPDDG